jgi:hypothetical protein
VNAQDKAIEAATIFAKRAPVSLVTKFASDMMVMVVDKAFTQVCPPIIFLVSDSLRHVTVHQFVCDFLHVR